VLEKERERERERERGAKRAAVLEDVSLEGKKLDANYALERRS